MVYVANKIKELALFTLTLLLLLACGKRDEIKSVDKRNIFSSKKILYLDSYHKTYVHNISTRSAFEKGLENRGFEIHYRFLDAKNIKDSVALKSKALKFKHYIDEWKPDIIIASDDAVNKYLIAPYYRNSTIPVVFIGVNWSADSYGYPTDNITGQLEIELVEKLLTDLKKYSSGDRVGILTGNTMTDRKNISHYKNTLNISFDEEVLVDDFSEWKTQFLKMQESVDVLLIRANSGIKGWNNNEARGVVLRETKIPTGSVTTKLENFVLLLYPKMNSEFGEYAASAVLKIFDGTSPKEIPISTNRRTKITINTDLAEKLDILFPAGTMEIAHLVGAVKKVLFVNSYHQGYNWSDGIERGLLHAFGIIAEQPYLSEYEQDSVSLRIVRMDTKREQEPSYIEKKALEVKGVIDTWKPHVVVASDDNAAKYLIAKYYKNSKTPFIFCGLNWDASLYGFPTQNITGIIEVAPVLELIEFLKKYAEGTDIGYLGADVISERKEINHYKKELGITFKKGYLVDDFTEWKKAYLALQKSVDILILVSHAGIKGWDKKEAEEFVIEHSSIPSGASIQMIRMLAMASFSRIPDEQGIWAGEQALAVLGGKKNIRDSRNKES